MKDTSFGISGTLYQWFDLGSQGVSGLSTNQTPSPRRSNQSWSSFGLCASSIEPQLCSLYPKPPSGFFCIFGWSCNCFPLCLSSVAQLCEYFWRVIPATPLQPTSRGSQEVCQTCPVHSSTSSWYLARFLSFAFPCALPYCEVQHDQLLGGIWQNDQVWLQLYWCCPVWELQLFAKIHFKFPVRCGGEEARPCLWGFSPVLRNEWS